ncbi:pyrroloquinoline quinone biosynthesis protein PqqE [Actinoplanes sp. NPDC051513]|uniref:pyrroloquinoline quinone biosynthesis protein PqqE n=1 Tax=Actinoplanes sp. NPDC051513 TaxID=3363908 RepID=UPI0037889B3B
MRPGLAGGCSLVHDRARDAWLVLYPEGVLALDEPAAAVLTRCDGRTAGEIVTSLALEYDGVDAASVERLLDDLIAQRVVADGGAPVAPRFLGGSASLPPGAPIGLVAELTHRCPLQCAYCSNPVALSRTELDRPTWKSIFQQASDLGVRQLHLTGGEPLLRRDLPDLVADATANGLYPNLITSGLGLSTARLAALVGAGLRHVQLSIQDSDPVSARRIAGLPVADRKRAAAAAVVAAGLPLTVNVVLHAANVSRVAEIAELAAALGATRLELAHTQFYGWALRNRAALIPTADQVASADRAVADAVSLLGESMQITYVRPDYLTGTPKPCMQGWGARQLVITPGGDVLPCLAAAQLPGPPPPNVLATDLATIWRSSELFNRFRGTDWLPSPCRTCDLREVDFGGCRCQAFQLTGDASATDPACHLSPAHDLVTSLRAPAVPRPVPVPRRFP